MAYAWKDRQFSTFEDMRDEVVYDWLCATAGAADEALGARSDADWLDTIYSDPAARQTMQSAGLNRDDVARGLRQARLGIEQQGLS